MLIPLAMDTDSLLAATRTEYNTREGSTQYLLTPVQLMPNTLKDAQLSSLVSLLLLLTHLECRDCIPRLAANFGPVEH